MFQKESVKTPCDKCSLLRVISKKTLLKWFNKKYKSQFVEISAIKKILYEKQNSINWKTGKCVIF